MFAEAAPKLDVKSKAASRPTVHRDAYDVLSNVRQSLHKSPFPFRYSGFCRPSYRQIVYAYQRNK